MQLAVVGFADKLDAKRRRIQRAKEQLMMRSDSEQQWLSRMSFHRPSHPLPSSGMDSRFGMGKFCIGKTKKVILGSDGEIVQHPLPPMLNQNSYIDKTKVLSFDQPTKMQIKTRRKSEIPNFVNGERIDEVKEE